MQRLLPLFASLCVLCGQAFALTLTAPLDYQVTQRTTRTGGKLLVAGQLAPNTHAASIEARLTGPGANGAWQPLAFKAGADAFRAELEAPAGGWFRLEVRALAAGKTL
ncbi:MAG: hypothetical protein EXS27_00455, partial [Pedosphaera sp.]|nr:hypothetical protein [Pedosphaera sp.]